MCIADGATALNGNRSRRKVPMYLMPVPVSRQSTSKSKLQAARYKHQASEHLSIKKPVSQAGVMEIASAAGGSVDQATIDGEDPPVASLCIRKLNIRLNKG